MKRVSFKVAKAIKEAGYPQDHNCDKYVTEQCKGSFIWYTPNPDCTRKDDDDDLYDFEVGEYVDHEMYNVSVAHSVVAPSYLEVWLWLCSQGYSISPICIHPNAWQVSTCNGEWDNPEEAIIAAIEYLVENGLIKQ